MGRAGRGAAGASRPVVWAVWSGAAALVLVGAVTWLDASGPFGAVPLMQALAPAGALVAVVFAVAVLRWFPAASVTALVGAALLFAPLVPDVTGGQPREPVPAAQREPGTLTVLAINTYFGRADAAARPRRCSAWRPMCSSSPR